MSWLGKVRYFLGSGGGGGMGGVGEFCYFFVGPPWRFDKKKTPDPPPISD